MSNRVQIPKELFCSERGLTVERQGEQVVFFIDDGISKDVDTTIDSAEAVFLAELILEEFGERSST